VKRILVINDDPGSQQTSQPRILAARLGTNPRMLILVLSAISNVEEVTLLLQIGVDDYIAKPFNPLEFLALMRAVIRRR
jgi:DNA-binding response OmpR family regulator